MFWDFNLTFHLGTGLLLLIFWEAVWKAMALWKSGRNNHLAWFIIILIFNTAGILPIFYLLFFQPKKIHKFHAEKREAKFKKIVNKRITKRRKALKKEIRLK